MNIQPLELSGAYLITPPRFPDERGYFMVPYQQKAFETQGLVTDWVQDNQSYSRQRGVLRGFHFQMPPYTETKLVRVIQGRIMDVIVDLRKESPTFGKWQSTMLTEADGKMLYIPPGFAHAFQVLSDGALVMYKVDKDYTPSAQAGLRWNDKTLNVPWPVKEPVLSAKDRELPMFADFESPF